MYKISNKTIDFITKTVKDWEVQLPAEGQALAKRHLPGRFTLAIATGYSNDTYHSIISSGSTQRATNFICQNKKNLGP